MAITPLDILQKQFPEGRKGFDPEQVRAFLNEVREAWEESLREVRALKDQLRERDTRVQALLGEQDDVRRTLQLARKLSEELEHTARREADVIVGEARLEAQRVLSAAQEEQRELTEATLRLRIQRERLLGELRALIEAHRKALDAIEGGGA